MKSFYIDFSCWTVLAESIEEAKIKAEKYCMSGQVPVICEIQETGEEVESDEIDAISIESIKTFYNRHGKIT